MFGPLGVPEMIFIMLLALLIFGPKRLPEIGRTLGKGMASSARPRTSSSGPSTPSWPSKSSPSRRRSALRASSRRR